MEAKVKNQVQLFTHSNSLPKIDLHAHLSGSIRKKTLIELLSEEDKGKLDDFYSKMDYKNAFEFFRISGKVMSKLPNVRRVVQEMTEDWNKHNTIYLEIRTTLKDGEGFTKKDYLKAVLEEIKNSNKKYPMITRLIISLNRTYTMKEYDEVYNIYTSLEDPELKSLIVGIDYCGYEVEEKHSYSEMIPVFNKFKEEGLKITIHMGECKDCKEFPFDKFIPDRVGHCYFFNENQLNEVLKRKIPIEVCPTSSYICAECNDYKKIPMKNFYKKEVKDVQGNTFTYDKIILCTDDIMLFLSDISQEYFEVASAFEMTVTELKDLVYKSIDYIFEKEEIKTTLREKVERYYI